MLELNLPPLLAIDDDYLGNPIQQVIIPSHKTKIELESFTQGAKQGYKIKFEDSSQSPILALHKNASAVSGFDRIIKFKLTGTSNEEVVEAIESGNWTVHPLSKKIVKRINYPKRTENVIKSWLGSFTFAKEDIDKGIQGLRKPQLGALHAIQAHWSAQEETATVVMPTGTGKTETMLSVAVLNQCQKILVVVPTDALRTQIGNKFLSLGKLKEVRAIKPNTTYPIVGLLKHELKTVADVGNFFGKCNVIVTTMQVISRCKPDAQQKMATLTPFLFIDEAHHIGARTWKEFKAHFRENRILQFTATPFREDGIAVDGKRIFTYPLKKAQEEGYFKKINFKPVFEYNPSKFDTTIAEAAVAQLRQDLITYDHLLMARVDSIQRADEVLRIYSQYTEFNPVKIHTGMKPKEREDARKKILSKKSKIVVCVDMLGEGFDLPELKIAAFHDVKKSLPTTLQLVGRFTRVGANLGEPTFIANAADVDVNKELQLLYSQDADWNVLLNQSSEKANKEQENLWDFLGGFQDVPEEVPLQNIRPALSTIIFKTKCDQWNPENFKTGIDGADKLEHLYHSVNPDKNTMFIITAKKTSIDWAKLKDVYDWAWELYVIYWDKDQKLLFINSSSNNGYFQNLAQAIAGDNVELIKGPNVFRCLSGVNRLMLQNVGLREVLGKFIRYIMRSGSDVESGLTDAERRKAEKANIFGSGYENGGKASIGCSYKGRIWSRRVGTIDSLTNWCSAVGKKILDDTINPDEILKGTLVPKPVSIRPDKLPISIDWPDLFYLYPEEIFNIEIDGTIFPLYETDIVLKDPALTGDIKFEIVCPTKTVELSLVLSESDGNPSYEYKINGQHTVTVKQHNTEKPLKEFFYHDPPMIWFADGSSIEGCDYIELKYTNPPYDPAKITSWDWADVDLQKESQKIGKETDSIQYKVIENLKTEGYEIIFDDDGSGEVADVITIKENDDRISLGFYHCKYSSSPTAGARIEDLYAVCGQAQKSIHWREKVEDIFRHMQKREPKHSGTLTSTRFEVGTRELLRTFQMKARNNPVDIEIFIVQPGVSKSLISQPQLQLLSATENYLMTTYQLPFKAITSA